MAKIYQFPNMRDKVQLESQMEIMQETMRELYDSLRKVELGCDRLRKAEKGEKG